MTTRETLHAPFGPSATARGVAALALLGLSLSGLACGSDSGLPTLASRDPNQEFAPRLVSASPPSGTRVRRGDVVPVTVTVVYRVLDGYARLHVDECLTTPPRVPGSCATYYVDMDSGVYLLPGGVRTAVLSTTLRVPTAEDVVSIGIWTDWSKTDVNGALLAARYMVE